MIFSQFIHSIKKVFSSILDFIIPKSEKIEKLESYNISVWKNLAKWQEHEGIIYIFPYQDQKVRQAIWEIKYRRNKNLRTMLLKIVSDFLMEELADKIILENFTEPIITSIPQSNKRKSERGYNQGEDIAIELSTLLHFPYQKILLKTKETVMQATLKRNERLLNMKNSFAILNKEKVDGKNIIVVDDVTTTGATLNEVKKVLLAAGARKIICVAVAH